MVYSASFWDYFDNEAAPKLAHRVDTFRKTFEYLDRFDRPVAIVETGCLRVKDNWRGDGQSTVLFDRYARQRPGSVVYTVDSDAAATDLCKSMVSDHVKVHTGDSVRFLFALERDRPPGISTVDLLYLDSFEADMNAPYPSASHHLKELLAISPLLSPRTLVVVDDSPVMAFGYFDGEDVRVFNLPIRIGGKGLLIAEYAYALGLKPYFTGYQCGWIGLGRSRADQARVGDHGKTTQV